MMNKGKYYSAKISDHNYSQALQECIEEACQFCIDTASLNSHAGDAEKEKNPLMMLGKIQSGKTRAYTGLMALAFDNRFDMVFILTKNSKALIQQTYKRMRREFKQFIYENEIEVFDIMRNSYVLTDYELDKKLVVIAKKEKSNLEKISQFISNYTIQQRKNCLIIDDEADTTGIGYSRIKDSNEFDLRTVASKVNDIRGSLDRCVFVQVTATPYALYLQPDFDEEGKLEPIKPKKTVLVPPGEGYIGGEYYFLKSEDENNPGRFIFEPVSEEEHELISDQKRKGKKSKIDDRRSFKEEEILTRTDRLQTFKKGLMNFVVGGCVLRMSNKNTHYAFVIHTATQMSSHISLESITKTFFIQIKNRTFKTQAIIDGLLSESYENIKNSVEAYGYSMPDFSDIKSAFFHSVDKEYISISIVNSENQVEDLLDEENGELKLRSPFSIFVGGQVLDRGVTIPRMIGFYYGRNPKSMQQDTVMQHSRMFGYRENEWLSVTRFFSTKRIYDNMIKITEIDVALREDIEQGKSGQGIYFIQRKNENGSEGNKGRIVPCSPNKILLSNVVLLKPGKRILPVGFTPVSKQLSGKLLIDLNNQLLNLMSEREMSAKLVSLEDLEQVIKLTFSVIEADKDSERFITFERFLTTMRYLVGKENEVYLIVRRGRDISKFKRNSITYQDAPDTPKGELGELSLAKKVALDKPVLMMLHQKGTAEGWGGREFWWPVLLIQQHINKTIFAMPEAGGRLRHR